MADKAEIKKCLDELVMLIQEDLQKEKQKELDRYCRECVFNYDISEAIREADENEMWG